MLTLKSFEFNPVQENTYILYNEFNECAIIDPGCYFDHEKDELTRFIETKQLKPKFLINTHCHLDHVFGNKHLAALYHLPLSLHEGEVVVLNFAPTSALMYNLPFDSYQGEFHFLKPGDEIKLGTDVLKVLFTPGHSPASISLYAPADGFVISGDALFRESIGRTDLPGGNAETLIRSIHSQLFALPDETKVYSGHGAPTTVGHEKKMNPYCALR